MRQHIMAEAYGKITYLMAKEAKDRKRNGLGPTIPSKGTL
jgi:hypothetical protein